MLNELDTSKVEPTYQVTGLVNIYQSDDLYKTLTQEEQELWAMALSFLNGDDRTEFVNSLNR